jgi:hypothetical protein
MLIYSMSVSVDGFIADRDGGWETDPSMRETELGAAFADVWSAIPKVVFSRTLERVQGNARLADSSLAEEVAAALAATDRDVEIGGAGLAAAAGPDRDQDVRLTGDLRALRPRGRELTDARVRVHDLLRGRRPRLRGDRGRHRRTRPGARRPGRVRIR